MRRKYYYCVSIMSNEYWFSKKSTAREFYRMTHHDRYPDYFGNEYDEDSDFSRMETEFCESIDLDRKIIIDFVDGRSKHYHIQMQRDYSYGFWSNVDNNITWSGWAEWMGITWVETMSRPVFFEIPVVSAVMFAYSEDEVITACREFIKKLVAEGNWPEVRKSAWVVIPPGENSLELDRIDAANERAFKMWTKGSGA